jgi:hypothetical protein
MCGANRIGKKKSEVFDFSSSHKTHALDVIKTTMSSAVSAANAFSFSLLLTGGKFVFFLFLSLSFYL